MSAGMLEGVRVLDLASVGPAARTSRWLADYGADVVKVGPVPRDGGVQITPPFYAYSGHRHMRRARIDLKSDAGRDAFLRLATTADVVIESFRPGVVDRLGIGYADVEAHNPGVVYCSTSGYGQDGPHRLWAGHDLNYLAVSGYLHCTQRRVDGGPPIPGATVADAAAGGLAAVAAICAALVQRARTGHGAYLDVAVADGALALMSLYVDEYLATGVAPEPGHYILTGRYACYDLYETADGGWLSVAAIEPNFWANLCRLLGLDRWAERQTDDEAQDEIRADLRRIFATRPRDAWVAELAPADTCVAPVLTVAEAIDDPQYAYRGVVVEAHDENHGTFRQVGQVLAGQDRAATGFAVRDPAATDTAELLADAGLDDREIRDLQAHGVIG